MNRISTTDKCAHCNEAEKAENYFFKSTFYTGQSYWLSTYSLATWKKVFGDFELSIENNVSIVNGVHQFIKST